MSSDGVARRLFSEEEMVDDPTRGGYFAPSKSPRLAVSDDVELTGLECAIMDAPHFQRLRRIRQLATTYLVFPSANHSRFEHSLGTHAWACHMMHAVMTNPASSPEQRSIPLSDQKVVRLAALLHDLANVPFGHTLEDEARVLHTNQDTDLERWEYAIGRDSAIGQILTKDLSDAEYNLLWAIMTTPRRDAPQTLGEKMYVHDIVKNTVCADLLDYIARDAYHCNLQLSYGTYFLKYLHLRSRTDGTTRVVVRLWKEGRADTRADVLEEIIHLLEARYHLGCRVYFHHAKQASSAMVARAVWSAICDGQLAERDLWAICDDELLYRLRDGSSGVASLLAGSLLDRRLHKRVFALNRAEADAVADHHHVDKLNASIREDREGRTETEDRFAELSGLSPGAVLLYCPDPEMQMKQAEVLVTWKDDIHPLYKVRDSLVASKLKAILDSHAALWRFRAFAAPGDGDVDLLQRWCEFQFGRGSISLRDVARDQVQRTRRTLALEMTADQEVRAVEFICAEAKGGGLGVGDFESAVRSAIQQT